MTSPVVGNASDALYLDSSALVKLVQFEDESLALRRYLRRHRDLLRVTSALARVEVIRAVSPAGPRAAESGRRQLRRCEHLALTLKLLDRAARLDAGMPVRSLDAIHLASAQRVPRLKAVLTYDLRMQAAARALGLPVQAPA